jgi:ubiquinone/menaquinone biosynthesis C-methylase UbiE
VNRGTLTSTTRSYAHLASDYDASRFSGQHGRFLLARDREIVRRFIQLAQPRRLLDAPVGTGRAMAYVADRPMLRIGLDFTAEMLAHAAVNVPAPTSLLRGDAGALPFKDASFDCVTSLRFFHLFTEAQRVAFAREFMRVLAPGGHLIISFTNGWYGGGLNWLHRSLGYRTMEFEGIGEVRRLFPECSVVRRYGNFLPKQWLVDGVPILGPLLRRATEHAPCNLICWERIYLMRKA